MSHDAPQEHQFNLVMRDDPHVKYMKVDQLKACRVDNDFAVTFFQYDYQRMAQLSIHDPTSPHSADLFPISRIVMNEATFKVLLAEILRIADKTGVKLDDHAK